MEPRLGASASPVPPVAPLIYPNQMCHPLTRREMLLRSANGFGAAALAALLRSRPEVSRGRSTIPFAPKKPHFPAKAKTVIFLFMDGGPSQVDTFDPKPRLEKEHGKPITAKVEPTQFNNVGNTCCSRPWKFQQVRPERPAGQRPVPARRPAAPTTWRHPLDGRRTSPSTPTPTTSCTPATASRAGRAWARGSPTAWAASAATCPASSCSAAA